eukprot:1290772-Pleurochrysis_carterae.AAC.2
MPCSECGGRPWSLKRLNTMWRGGACVVVRSPLYTQQGRRRRSQICPGVPNAVLLITAGSHTQRPALARKRATGVR